MLLYFFNQSVSTYIFFLCIFLFIKQQSICINSTKYYFQVKDVLNNTDWPFVNLHYIISIQCSDLNIILLRLAIPMHLWTLPFYALVCVLLFLTTPLQLPFYCPATAIIAEHSYFLWKQKPSASSAPFKSAAQKFNSSADLSRIKTAIEEASHLKTKDLKDAVVKIALENCLCQYLCLPVYLSHLFDLAL